MTGKTCLASTVDEPWAREIKSLREAWTRQDARGLAQLEKSAANNHGALADHPLRIFAEYWRLSARLAAQPDAATGPASEDIRRFIGKNPETRVAHTLRREWLQRLGKARQWDVFTEQYVKHTGDEGDIACYAWQERLDRQDAEVLAEARALWNSGRTAPEVCDPLFQAVLASGQVDTERQWVRLGRLLEQGAIADVRRMLKLPGLTIRIDERRLSQAHNDPGRFLQQEKLDPRQRASLELFMHASRRYARRDAADAAAWFGAREASFAEPGRVRTWAEIAAQGAQQHEPRAVEWYAKAAGAALTEAQSEWRVRAALRARDWKATEAAVLAMPAAQRRDGAWRYWLARSLAEQDRRAEAAPIREELAREFNFYGLLAAEEIGKLALPAFTAIEPTTQELDSVRQIPALQRSLLLYKAGLTQEGLGEWRWALRGLTDRQYIAASALAEAAGIPDRALNAADRTVAQHDLTRRFPLPITEQLVPAAREQSLDPAWVYGLIKQESAFLREVRSSAGAIGLMQLMPATARWAATKTGLKNYHTANLTDPALNLSLGTWYLRHVYEDLNDPILATAAYNAGPGRARRWRAEVPLEGAIYAETIPFNETRDYVKRVMANKWFYAGRLGAPKASFKSMVGTVPARGNVNIVAIDVTEPGAK
ncbi:MAG: transglycosylase SLT domain-containing protein [Burkholderiales bacterium]|nr:transglycosylase SLT domain-containing protein [Burkholderiales bacterium]